MKQFWGLVFVMLLGGPVWAADCVEYKKIPRIIFNTPDWQQVVVQPREPMDLWHGNVVATLVDNYDVVVDVTPVADGFCVGLKTVNATVGYSDFVVQVDIRHTPNTCAYDAIVAHENKHIKTYLDVMDSFKPELQQSVFRAADSVMPIFVAKKQDADAAVDMINNEMQNHPELVLVKQKIRAAQEIENKQVDINENGAELAKCVD